MMKLVFSEAQSDYANYIFPYAIWAFPEGDETAATMFGHGFLPASRDLDRYYMCRHIRIRLERFQPSSENRRIFRKGEGIEYKLIPAEQFAYTPQWRRFCLRYADIKFGKNVMTRQRLDSLFNSKIISHLLVYTDKQTQTDIGIVTLHLEEPNMAYYYYAFYDLNYYERNLGMFMMTSAVQHFAALDYGFIYLGTCYSRNALYKTQFAGAEFFNGFCWSDNLKELKYLIKRDKTVIGQHLVETEEYRNLFYDADLAHITRKTQFSVDTGQWKK